ncbi:efflux RND transporter permease subunit [Roseimaritima ulvae]|uniref:Efflux pump membrane transporter BepE n=1 Tax=Roseimaritima ulvae TaxID=980254 RepID=A0A5B9QPL9_9BACT|nr:efflux RND transporter permease subunit [Roseimaritima ulvae]QEG41037.1 Efflux pump membrane transporter BepE [Roseimaritima ulvae]
MRRLPEFAVRRPTVVITFVLILVAMGCVNFLTMPRREDPEFTLKVAVVSTDWPGASAEQVEELLTDPLEEAIDGMEEVKLIRSNSSSEASVIFVELEDRVPSAKVDDAWDRVRARVRNVAMPVGASEPFVNDEFADTSVILFAVHQRPLETGQPIDPLYAYSHRQIDDYSEQVRDALRLLPGVAKVERHGVRDEAIFIETDEGTWSQLGLTIEQVRTLAQNQNIVAPGGRIDADDGRFFVKPDAEVNAVGEIRDLVVDLVDSSAGARAVRVQDMGLNVRRDYVNPPLRLCRYGDPNFEAPANIVAVTMKSGANIIDICTNAKQRVADLQSSGTLPPDVDVSIISDQSDSVNQRIREVVVNVIEAILIVVAVVFLVVGFRTAAVMAANIPFVVLVSLGIVTLFDVQLEQMSLAAMIISLGLLVDNAVQVCDQARTNQIAGMSPREAAVSGAAMLGASMLNGTLTTIAAFIPMVIAMDGANREFIYSLPITLSVTLCVSWVLAMTFCVILAAWFIRPPKDPNRPTAPLPWLMAKLRAFTHLDADSTSAAKPKRWRVALSRVLNPPSDDEEGGNPRGFFYWLYGVTLGLALRHRFLTIGLAVAALMLTTQLSIPNEFFPLTERDQFAVEIWLPESASIEQTDAMARQVEDTIRKLSPYTDAEGNSQQRLLNMRTIVGGGGSRWYLAWEPEAIKPNYAEILVHTTNGKVVHDFAENIRKVTREGDATLGIEPVVGARVVPTELMLGPPADPVVLRVTGEGFADISQLRTATNRVKEMVDAEPDTWDVNDSWGYPIQQLEIDIDTQRASLSGIRNSEIADTLDAYFSGKLLTQYRENERLIPIYFRLKPDSRRSLDDLLSAHVESDVGKVPLESVADGIPRWKPGMISRRDGNRTIEIRSQINFGASGNDITKRVFDSEEMDQLRAELPPGFRVEIGGALEESMKAQGKMLKSFGMSFMAIIVLLIIQFNSVFRTSIIIATLPLAMAGGLLGLYLTNNAFGFMPQLGVLALFGIVLNAAILFVEFADITLRARGQSNDGRGIQNREEFQAVIISAGEQRLMPIFLTTATTVGGLFPLAVAGGPLWVGMAWLMISGLTFATLLTLILIPVLYSFSYRFLQRSAPQDANAAA